MDNPIFIVKGVSGSGKSSRVFQLLKFFEDYCNFEIDDLYYENVNGKNKNVGVLVKELNLVFIGKKYPSGEVERWQGYDSVTANFVKSEYFSDFLRDNKDKYIFVVEGAGVTGTNRLRPEFLNKYCGYKRVFIQYYNYSTDQKDIYLQRIFDRSGKFPNKGTMWNKVKGFEADHKKALEDSNTIKDCEIFIDYGAYDLPIEDFGLKFLIFFELEYLAEEFDSFVKEFNYINKNKYENFQ